MTVHVETVMGEPINGTTMVTPVPELVEDGDLMLCILAVSTNDPPDELFPVGLWESHGKHILGEDTSSDPAMWVYSRIADNEPADYSWIFTIGSGDHGGISILRGEGATVDSVLSNLQVGSGTDIQSPNAPGLGAGDAVVYVALADSLDPITMVSQGATELANSEGIQGSGSALAWAFKLVGAGGDSGIQDWTVADDQRSGFTIVIKAGAPVPGLAVSKVHRVALASVFESVLLRAWLVAKGNNVEQLAGAFYPRGDAVFFQCVNVGVVWDVEELEAEEL